MFSVFMRIFCIWLCFSASPSNAATQKQVSSVPTMASPTQTSAGQGMAPKTNLQLAPQISWQLVEKGLEYAHFPLAEQGDAKLVVVRINPQYFDFVLHSTGKDASYPKTLDQWATEKKLVAVINASMYLPGGRSTGYMRDGDYINNDHIAKKFGAFFVANRQKNKEHSAKIIEKSAQQTPHFLQNYELIIQNYRLISSERKILWSAGGQKHSIAAVGEDAQGRILFMHCRTPIDAHTFATIILRLPLDVRTVMYVEGGAQAGMVLRQGNTNTFWGGRHPADFFLGNVAVALPNVLGVQRKQTP